MGLSRDQAFAALQRIFQEVFDDDGLSISEEMARENFPNWDSLAHIRLVAAIEETLGISFTIEQIEGMTGVGRILESIVNKH